MLGAPLQEKIVTTLHCVLSKIEAPSSFFGGDGGWNNTKLHFFKTELMRRSLTSICFSLQRNSYHSRLHWIHDIAARYQKKTFSTLTCSFCHSRAKRYSVFQFGHRSVERFWISLHVLEWSRNLFSEQIHYNYSQTSSLRSTTGLSKSDLNGEVTVSQGLTSYSLHCRRLSGTVQGWP